MRWLCVVPFMLLSASAFAQQGLATQVYACAYVEDAARRHVCFDTLVPELKKAGGAAAAAVAKPSPPPPPSQSQSPLTAPVLSPVEAKTAKVQKEVAVDRVSLAVKSIATGLDGKYRFTMENGQVWKQVDTMKLRNLGDGPWRAEIRKAALGSFLLSVDKSAAIRVERMN
jgi:hypothetical protein